MAPCPDRARRRLLSWFVIEELLDDLCTPTFGRGPLTVRSEASVERDAGGLVTATLVGPDGSDPSHVRAGVWEAIGPHRPQRSAAQLTNALPMSPWFYERLWRPGAMTRFSGRSFPLAAELAEMDDAVGEVDRRLVVDVGCAEGLMARHLAKRGARVLAIDHSAAYCRKARQRARSEGVAIAATRAVAQHLPVRNGAAAAVVMGGTLNEIGDRAAALAEVARVLAPGGRAYVVSLLRAHTRPGAALQRLLDVTGIEFPDLDATNAVFARAGLTVVEQRVEGIAARTTLQRPVGA